MEYSMKKKRTELPASMIQHNEFSIWAILKQCIGKELSKITMPVVFNEPLSLLQRFAEYIEYSYLIDHASKQTNDSLIRMQYVAAFAVSSVSSNLDRVGKSFNPILGETYELVRNDLGFKLVSEQVSHHPPISAFHAHSTNYLFHGTVHPKLRFWGKSVEIQVKGDITLELPQVGDVYMWGNVNCGVHNIIVGKLWIEHCGNMEICNHTTGDVCHLTFRPSGWFGKHLHRVEGIIINKQKEKKYFLWGKWVDCLYAIPYPIYEEMLASMNISKHKWRSMFTSNTDGHCTGNNHSDDSQETDIDDHCDIYTKLSSHSAAVLLWKVTPRPANSDEMYNFTSFALTLNDAQTQDESTAGRLIPPTDSRHRPDIRLLEEGNIDGAASEKQRLEDKQRVARKQRAKAKEHWSPLWFREITNSHSGNTDWVFNGRYWDCRPKKWLDLF